MRRLSGKTISFLSSLNALLIHWRKIQFSPHVNSCPPVETPSEDVNDISTALSTSSLDNHQWPITSAVFFISPTINWSSFNQLVDASLDSSFRGYSFVNFRTWKNCPTGLEAGEQAMSKQAKSEQAIEWASNWDSEQASKWVSEQAN